MVPVMAELPDTSFNSDVIAEFRANSGKVGGPWQKATLLLLHTEGAKTGMPRVSPLGRIEIDGRVFIVASYGGAEVNPAWVHNLRVHPKARIETGAETLDVVARELPSDERNAVWARIVDAAPAFAQYQSQTTRTITVFELTRT
jgi:deazaflavin-dependent oxidoreductase (nitroreductase family)